MEKKITEQSSGSDCKSLFDSFTHVFDKVAHVKATPSRLDRLVSIIQRIEQLSTCEYDMLQMHHSPLDGDVIGAVMVDCLCNARRTPARETLVSTASSSSSAGHNRSQNTTKRYEVHYSQIVLRCMYALSHVLRQCRQSHESPFMKKIVHLFISRLDEIEHAIARIPASNIYERVRIKKVLYLWRQEGILKGTGVITRLLACLAKLYSDNQKSHDHVTQSRPCLLLEQDVFERRMKSMEHASSHVMYMKHPLVLCD